MLKRKLLLHLSLAAALLFSASAFGSVSSRVSAARNSDRKGKSAAHVSAQNVARHVEYLASDKLQGRRAGTPNADQAARYITKAFKEYGLRPLLPAGLLQSFSFVAAVRLGEANRFQINPGGPNASSPRLLKAGVDFMPLAFSSSDAVKGDVVFAGFGISAPQLQYDNYSGLDVTGKIVMMLRGSPDGDNPHGRFAEYTQPGLEIQNKTLKAREKGARGVIFISEQDDFHRDSLSRLRHDLNFLDAGIAAVAISRESARAILTSAGTPLADLEKKIKDSAAPVSLDGVTLEFKTDVVKVNSTSANVVGVLPGSDPSLSKQYVVIGAHYDHLGLGGTESLAQNPEGQIHHGADDNASGTSAVLELARVLSGQRALLKRSVIFIAFSGEEEGLLGSGAYTRNPGAPLSSTVAMINMDMIGRLRENKLVIGGAGTSPAWKPLIEKLNGSSPDHSFKLSLQDDGFGPSDHQSFYVRDIPVLFFFTGSHDDYHKPTDTAEKINTEGVRQIAEFVLEIAVSIANEPERVAFSKVQRQSQPTGSGFRVYLGTVPNYSDQADGLKLDGVRSGSPAERAGLRAGDVIVRLGATAVKNVYDYTYALGELRPGQEVDVVIRREGKETTLKVTPEKRQ